MNSRFIGQDTIIRELENFTKHPELHVLLRGASGCGKTHLAKWLAASRGDYTYSIAPNIPKVFNRKAITHIVDEVHELRHPEILFDPMERFGFIFATTDVADVKETLINRCVVFNLREYSEKDLAKICILEQPNIPADTAALIASRCRGVPRIVKQLANRLVISNSNLSYKNAEKFFNSVGILRDGFTYLDMDYLGFLVQYGKPASIKTIADYIGVDASTVLNYIEPFLVKKGKIVRTSKGRQLR